MGILEIISKSLGKAFKPLRFLPFFILYFLFAILALVLLRGVLQSSLQLWIGASLYSESANMLLISLALVVSLVAISVINIWLNGALIFSLFKGRKFANSLGYPKRFFWRMVLLNLLWGGIFILLSLLGDFSLVIIFLLGWIFIFSIPSIVIRDDGVLKSLKRSYEMVRKNPAKTFAFYLATGLICFVLLFIGFFLAEFSAYPLLVDINQSLPGLSNLSLLSPDQSIALATLILKDYPVSFQQQNLPVFGDV